MKFLLLIVSLFISGAVDYQSSIYLARSANLPKWLYIIIIIIHIQ